MVVGVGAFYVAMTAYAVLVFQQFNALQVLGVALSFAGIFATLFVLLSSDLRSIRLHPTLVSVVVGLVFSAVLLVLAFTWTTTRGPIWSEYFPSFPNVQLAQGSGFHQDAVYHVSLIQSILTFGYPSTGQNGVPLVPYHVLSHYTDALVLLVTRLEPYDSYGLFFHFKVALFLAAIVTFIWVATRRYSRVVFVVCLVFLTPVLLSTWIGVGSHPLWMTSLILILSAKRVFDIVSASTTSGMQYLFIFLVGAAVGLGKVSSGFMFVVFVGVLMWLKAPRRRGPYVLLGAWLVFYGVYWKSFNIGHSSGLQRPSFRATLHFLDFFKTYGGGLVEWNLGALYLLLVFFAISAVVFRSQASWRFAIATAVGGVALTAVTQTLAGLTQPDLFYFIYGLLVPVILLGLQQLWADLNRGGPLSERLKGLNPRLARVGLVLALIAAATPMDKPPVSAFMVGPGAIEDSVTAANSAHFKAYNLHRAPDEQVSLASIVLDGDRLEFNEDQAARPTEFRAELRAFMDAEGLTPRNTLLFVPKEAFDSSVASYGGPSWARGMMLYALLGVPLLHGIEDESLLSFGQSSYRPDAAQQSLAEFDPQEACSHGKQVIVVQSWTPADFALVCPA